MRYGLADVWRDSLRRRLAIDQLASLDPTKVTPGHPLFGRTVTEVNRLVQELRSEENLLTILMLFAAAEAEIRRHAGSLANSKNPSPVAQELRKLYRSKSKKQRLIDIVKVWRASGHQVEFGAFQEIAKTRNWLTHGRYWTHAPQVTAALAWSQLASVLSQVGLSLTPQPASPW